MEITFIGPLISSKLFKGLVLYWLKDEKILQIGASASIDYFQKRTKDYYEARKMQRFFDELADKVTKDLTNFIRNEHSSLKKGDLKVILEECMEIITKKEFYDFCIENRLDVDRIRKNSRTFYLTSTQKIRVSNEIFESIFQFFLLEFLSVIDALPEFNRVSIRQILSDIETVIEKINFLQSSFDSAHSSISEDFLSAEAEYRKSLSRSHSKINLFGINSRSLSKRYDLSIAYISLSLSSYFTSENLISEELLSTEQVLNCQFNVISGAAGSGKTTLLSWLAFNCANRSLPAGLVELNSYLPIFFRIREYTSKDLPTGTDIINEQLGALKGTLDTRWINSQIKEGKFLFLLDGYDEVPTERRGHVNNWISDLGQTFSNASFFISTRPYAETELIESLSFYEFSCNSLHVEPMDLVQIGKFIDHWYRAYGFDAQDAEQVERLRAAKERLKDIFSKNSNIRSISNNPLLCALICFVNADRDGFIPTARGELYHIATETLLERRERERQIVFDNELHLTKNQKFKILGFVAEYMFQRRSSQLPVDDICRHLKDFLPALGIDSSSSNDVVEYLTARSHILRSPSEDSIDFSHKTFQEYFYARRIVDSNNRELVLDEFFNQELSEVIIFTCAVSPSEFAGAVIGSAYDKLGNIRNNSFRERLIFIYTCLTEVAEIDPKLRSTISKRLKSILPPKSTEEAENLGSAGRSVIQPIVQYSTKEHKKVWTYCTSALISTFDEEAFPALSVFAKLNDAAVDKVLMKGKRFFESKKYNEIVLSNCKTISSLTISDYFDFELLNALSEIKTVTFKSYESDFSELELKPSIESLKIIDCYSIGDLSILKSLPNLKHLEIEDFHHIYSFDQIGKCRDLKYLKIWSDNLQDANFLKNLDRLCEVDFAESVNLSDVKEINRLPSISDVILPFVSLYDQLHPRLRKEVEILDNESSEFFSGDDDYDLHRKPENDV